ncbi:hypothetical protein niasHT_035081 [Heterodera trifolii]|uniref:Transposase n=1 Tax=Heterodera trifolii TaxID=157864 RepID=A0ABD2IGW3_9BILA
MELKDRDDTIKFLREQVRNREALITDLRRQLEQCAETPTATPTTSKTTPNRGRPRKAIDELQRSSRKRLTEQILDAIDRDRSRSASRCSLERIHREVRHKFGHDPPKIRHFTAIKKGEFGLIRKCNLVFWLVTLKRRICAPLRYEQIETNGGVGFVCADVRSALESRFCAAKDNLITFGNNISVKISGDYGQSFTKITVSFFQAVRSNSPSNNFIVAVFPAKDSRENLERYGEALWGQIEQIDALAGKTVHWWRHQLYLVIAWSLRFSRYNFSVPNLHAQILSPNDLDGLERSIDDFKVFLAEQDRMSAFLSKKPKAHLLLFHFVPFARQHQFIGLLDEQGDEALHSVWRRLEQWWKCMPDAEQILQQLEHHFVNNWLLDTGRIDELKRNYEERKGEDDTDEEAAEEIDDECQIDWCVYGKDQNKHLKKHGRTVRVPGSDSKIDFLSFRHLMNAQSESTFQLR